MLTKILKAVYYCCVLFHPSPLQCTLVVAIVGTLGVKVYLWRLYTNFGVLFPFPVYVGCATVGAAAWWFMVYEEGPKLNYYQLVSYNAPSLFARSFTLKMIFKSHTVKCSVK